MKRVTDLPQTVLRQVLSQAQTRANTMTTDELRFAARICDCSICSHLWVKRKPQNPARCPACHSTAWNRPMINAMARADEITTKPEKQGGVQ